MATLPFFLWGELPAAPGTKVRAGEGNSVCLVQRFLPYTLSLYFPSCKEVIGFYSVLEIIAKSVI